VVKPSVTIPFTRKKNRRAMRQSRVPFNAQHSCDSAYIMDKARTQCVFTLWSLFLYITTRVLISYT